MQIEEAIEGLNKDVYGLKNFLTDTEKEKWQDAIDTVLNELERYKQLINKKNARLNEYAEDIAKRDKVIDLMARMLNSNDIDEDICRQVGKDMNCNEYTKEENCIKCIKEYFYKKVEGKE